MQSQRTADSTHAGRAEELLRLQQQVLERIATGSELDTTLDGLCDLVENIVPESVCSSMLLDERTGELNVGSAPCVPAELRSGLNGTVPGEVAGSCAAAVFTKKPVYVSDTATDPRWVNLRDVAERFGIKACWSYPILVEDERVLGTFAISLPRSETPDSFHEQVLETSANLAGIAVTKKLNEDERRGFDAQVQHAQKLESLGVLAGGIAHDFNNLLVGVLGHAEMALSELPPDSPVQRRIEEITLCAKSAADLCRQMLAYAGKGQLSIEAIDLNQIVSEIEALVNASISKMATIEFTLDPDLPSIEADATQIGQIVMNLVTNGSEALDDRSGVISVETRVEECLRADLDGYLLGESLAPGQYVILQVADTGCGMDRGTRARIFDPFFTTKFAGRGLGLAAVQGIVRRHRGALRVETEPGRGTRVSILFPSLGTRVEASRLQPVAATERAQRGTVLIVDDEETVREVARQMLEREGYEVLVAKDGRAGVELHRRHAPEIACVLLDLTMPVMGGEEALRELVRHQPDVRVLLASGYSEHELLRRFSERPVAGFVSKPFELRSLVGAVQRAIGGVGHGVSAATDT